MVDLSKRNPNRFRIARAKAINTYAMVEVSMAQLFEYLLQADSRKSYFVFSRLVNPRSKRQCLTKLMQLTYADKYEAFFSSLMRQVGELDEPRNKIVHWIAKYSIVGGKEFDPLNDEFLCDHPNIYGGEKMKISEINDFIKKADFLQSLIYHFCLYLKLGQRPDEPGEAWPEIFQKQCTYPPPKDHPLAQLRKKPEDPPQSRRQ